jgi:hypothetical protein
MTRAVSKLKLLPIVLGLAIGLPPALAGQPQAAAAGRKLAEDMIDALGGKAFLEIREVEAHGTAYGFRRDEINGFSPYIDFVRFPDTRRTEWGSGREKRIEINKGPEGWILTGRDGRDVKPQSEREIEEFLDRMKTSFQVVVRSVLNTPESTLLSTGSQIVDSRRADLIEVRDKDKNLIRFFIDRQTRLPLRMQVRPAGESSLYEEAYANWHTFQGVVTPLFVTQYKDGVKTFENRREKVVYNGGLADSLFGPSPAK